MRTLDKRSNGLNSSGFCNATNSTWKLGSPEGRIAEIMILICLMTSLLVFLTVFGTWRRRSRSVFLKGMLWTAYATSTFLIPYILGLIQEAPFQDKLFFIWGMVLLIAYAFPDSFSAYSPEDLVQWKLYYFQFLVKFCGLAILWVLSINFKLRSGLEFVVLNIFTAIAFLKVVKRSVSLIWASPPSLEEKAKVFEVYMNHEHELTKRGSIDPLTMEGYNYCVGVTGLKVLLLEDVLTPSDLEKLLQREDVVTLKKVWSCKGRLLTSTSSGGQDNKLKDICLSFAFLKILSLKYAGYALPEDAQPKARRLILEVLSNKERAFRVIEVELKLLYEFIYTKYPLYASAVFPVPRVVEFVLSLVVCGLSTAYMSNHANSLESVRLMEIWGFNWDVLVTYVLLGMILFAEIIQMAKIVSSEWAKVALLYNYVARKSWQNNGFAEEIIKRVCNYWYWKPWSRMLGQYHLVESRGYGTETWISTIASTIYPDKNWDWQEERKAIPLSDQVKEAVLDSLRAHLINLGNGRSSGLRHNSACEKLQRECKGEHEAGVILECKGEHEAEVILVSHIATSYCLHRSSASSESKNIATDLSNYLTYLVAFAPKLLPGPRFEPQFHFRRAMKEAKEAFKGCKNAEDRIGKLHDLAMQDKKEDRRIIARGARLGKQLSLLPNVWEKLAEFWSEMTLCAATSGEVRAHLEKLANGGEFITHLWALLHQAGIPSSDQPPGSSSGDGVASGSSSQPSAMALEIKID